MTGETLRAAREAEGLSLADLAERTRIPALHLKAREEGQDDLIPPGPYRAAYIRTVCEVLDIEPPEELPPPPGPPPRVPLKAVRVIALVCGFTNNSCHRVFSQKPICGGG